MQDFNLTIEIKNDSSSILQSLPPYPIHLSYHWLDFKTGETVVNEGIRTPLPRPLPPDHSGNFKLHCTSPSRSKRYNLIVTLVQENVAWWNSAPFGVLNCVEIEVE
jgi:hypothetical protein